MKQTDKMDAISQVLDKTQCYFFATWSQQLGRNFRQQTICDLAGVHRPDVPFSLYSVVKPQY